MPVYGDSPRREAAAAKLDRVRNLLQGAAILPPGLARHSGLIAALIEAGELAQGLADAHFHAVGERDSATPAVNAAMALAVAIADGCALSWSSGFAESGALPRHELDDCATLVPTTVIDVKQPAPTHGPAAPARKTPKCRNAGMVSLHINPAHPMSKRIAAHKVPRWMYDPTLLGRKPQRNAIRRLARQRRHQSLVGMDEAGPVSGSVSN